MSLSDQNPSANAGPPRQHADRPEPSSRHTAARGAGVGVAAAAQACKAGRAPDAPWHGQAELGRPRAPEETTAPGDADQPWDELSAEALMRACETAEAELGACPPPRRPTPGAERETKAWAPGRAAAADREHGIDPVALERRLNALAGTLDKWREELDPEKSLSAFHQHLAQFERRLEVALANLTRCGDASAMLLIEGQVGELTAELAATRKELGRLEAIDGRLNALAELVSARQQPREEARAGSLGRAAADQATQPFADPDQPEAAPLPPAAAGRERRGADIISSFEQLLERCVAERRGDEQRSAGVLRGIDDALARIFERISNIEEAKAGPRERDESDDLCLESDRLAEAYAAGARALGQEPFTFALDAADYAAMNADAMRGTASGTAAASVGEPGAGLGADPRAAAAAMGFAPVGGPSPMHAGADPASQTAAIAAGHPEAPAEPRGEGRAQTPRS